MSIPCRLSAVLLFFTSCLAAHADAFTFNFSGSGQAAIGTLIANPTANPGKFLISSISGAVTGTPSDRAIANLLPPGTYNGNDNLLEPSGIGLIADTFGFSFLLVNGVSVNLFTFKGVPGLPIPAGQYLSRSDVPNASFLMTTWQIVPVPTPEPASWLLLTTGGLGVLGAMRGRWVRGI